jgi:serine/threonine-protein kinase
MATASPPSLGACTPFVSALTEARLLLNGHHASVEARLKAFPECQPSALAEFLVEKGFLTRFQADAALQGKAKELLLATYTLVDVLGTGSMGTVYRARSTQDDGTYAIKVIPRRNAVSLPAISDKVRAFKTIRHPRVSALLHIGAQGERVYLVWPYLDGGDKLDAVVQRQGQLSPTQAVQIGIQVASGLQAYHEHGLYHGLLKASDILIGADRRVRILDFGVGVLLACERGKSLLDTMTNTRALARGLDCASPESTLNPLDRSPAGDQYSLGCILYFCMAGQYPFPNEQPMQKMMAIQLEASEPIRNLNPHVHPRLAAILDQMMQKKPADRFKSMAEVVEAFRGLSSAKGRSSSIVVPVKGVTQRTPLPATKPAVAAPEPVARPADPAPSPKTHPEDAGGGVSKILLLGALAVGAALGIVLTWLLRQG